MKKDITLIDIENKYNNKIADLLQERDELNSKLAFLRMSLLRARINHKRRQNTIIRNIKKHERKPSPSPTN